MAEENKSKSRYEQRKAEKQKKKEKKKPQAVSLPRARAMAKRSRDTAQAKADYEGIVTLVASVVGVLFLLFILMGGINQRKTLEMFDRWGEKMGQMFAINAPSLEVTDDGVYLEGYSPSGGSEE